MTNEWAQPVLAGGCTMCGARRDTAQPLPRIKPIKRSTSHVPRISIVAPFPWEFALLQEIGNVKL